MAENYRNESMVDVAYSYLKETNRKVKFNDLFNVISERIGFTEEEKENLISNFYTNLSLDGRFVTLGNNEWDLRSNQTYDKVHIDMNDIYTDMEELIPISNNNGRKAVNARDLHVFLESKQDFSTWIKNRIEKYDLVENEDYVLLHNFVEQVSGTKHRIDYVLSIDAAKELSMVEGNEKGKQARRYFIACERLAKEKSLSTPRKRTPSLPTKVKASLLWVNGVSETLRLNESSKLLLLKKVGDPLGLPTPDYVPSKGILKSAGTLLKECDSSVSAQVFNKKMMEAGMMENKSRPSSSGKIKHFKSIIGEGLNYGENQVNPNNPKETQPLYYEDKFLSLIKALNI